MRHRHIRFSDGRVSYDQQPTEDTSTCCRSDIECSCNGELTQSSVTYGTRDTKCGDRVLRHGPPNYAAGTGLSIVCGLWWCPVLCAPWEPEQWSIYSEVSCLTVWILAA